MGAELYYTQDAPRRPDLEAREVNPPEGYIGGSLVPVTPVLQKSGTIYYAEVVADQAAQTGRNAGAVPTATRIAPASTTYTVAERIRMAQITIDEVKQYGGIQRADEIGSDHAKRSVLNAQEGDVRDMLFPSSPSNEIDVSGLRAQIQEEGIQALRRYPGRSVLVSSTITLKNFVTAIAGTEGTAVPFSRIVTGTNSAEAAMGLSLEAWLRGLALFLGVDEVRAGDDAIWNEGNAENGLAMLKIPLNVDELTHKHTPMFGRVLLYLPDGTQPYEIQSYAHMRGRDNEYTATSWYDAVVLNSGACVRWSLPVES